MNQFTSPPWHSTKSEDHIVIRGSDGDSICAMKRNTGDRLPEEQDANAAIITLAPEFFLRLQELLKAVRRLDPYHCEALGVPQTTDEELDCVVDEVEALLGVAADEGIVLEALS